MKPVFTLLVLLILALSTGMLSCASEEETTLDEIPFEINPDPSVCFPQLKTDNGEYMEAQLFGEMVRDGCYLRIDNELIIWRPGYFVNNNEGTIEILDRNGEVVAREGEDVYMSGGEIQPLEWVNTLIKEPLPQDCEGPFWLQGEVTRLDSE